MANTPIVIMNSAVVTTRAAVGIGAFMSMPMVKKAFALVFSVCVKLLKRFSSARKWIDRFSTSLYILTSHRPHSRPSQVSVIRQSPFHRYTRTISETIFRVSVPKPNEPCAIPLSWRPALWRNGPPNLACIVRSEHPSSRRVPLSTPHLDEDCFTTGSSMS